MDCQGLDSGVFVSVSDSRRAPSQFNLALAEFDGPVRFIIELKNLLYKYWPILCICLIWFYITCNLDLPKPASNMPKSPVCSSGCHSL